jgi:hypothetical protein
MCLLRKGALRGWSKVVNLGVKLQSCLLHQACDMMAKETLLMGDS